MTKRLNGLGDRLKRGRRESPPSDPVEDALLRSAETLLDGNSAAKRFDDFGDCREEGHEHRIKTVRCDSQYPNALLAHNDAFWHTYHMISPPSEADSPEAIGERLKLLRSALGLSQTQMAERYGLESQQAWANYERAKRPLDYRIALTIANKEGASLDWIYRGMEWTLPPQVTELLTHAKPIKRGRPRKLA